MGGGTVSRRRGLSGPEGPRSGRSHGVRVCTGSLQGMMRERGEVWVGVLWPRRGYGGHPMPGSWDLSCPLRVPAALAWTLKE